MEHYSDNKETEQVLHSAEGMKRASAPAHLLGRIENRLAAHYPIVRTLPFRTVSVAAAGLLLLLAANMYILTHNNPTPTTKPDAAEILVNYYGLNDNGYGL